MIFAMIHLRENVVANGVFLAAPSQVGSSDEEIVAIFRREAPVERAAQVESLMNVLALRLLHAESPSAACH